VNSFVSVGSVIGNWKHTKIDVMGSVTRLTATLLALLAPAVCGYVAEADEIGRPQTSIFEVVGDLAPMNSSPLTEPSAMREKAPDSPGPPRRSDVQRHCKRAEGGRVGTVSPTIRLSSRPDSDRDQCAILWARSVASSLQLQRVLLQI
jgi:hypothetical protein